MEHLSDLETRTFLTEASRAIAVQAGLGAFFEPAYLRSNGLVAALFGGDFRDRDQVVSRACTAAGVETLSCATFDATSSVSGFRAKVSHDDLSRVREQYHTPSYVISDN